MRRSACPSVRKARGFVVPRRVAPSTSVSSRTVPACERSQSDAARTPPLFTSTNAFFKVVFSPLKRKKIRNWEDGYVMTTSTTTLFNSEGKKVGAKSIVEHLGVGRTAFVGKYEIKCEQVMDKKAMLEAVPAAAGALKKLEASRGTVPGRSTPRRSVSAAAAGQSSASASASLRSILQRRRQQEGKSTRVVPAKRKPFSVRLANPSIASGLPAKKVAEAPTVNVYAVMCTKVSTKKRKSYVDAVLVLDGKYAILKDMEGKQLAKQATRFTSLRNGESLGVGRWDTEVENPIDTAEYTSGRVFLTQMAPTAAATISNAASCSKRFAKPRGKSGGRAAQKTPNLSRTTTSARVRGRHDANAEGAVVLAQASEFPDRGRGTAAIVLDPFLAQKLRPHQHVGAKFLLRCVMGLAGFNGCGAILADEMGLGKTLTTISVCWTLLKQGPYGRPVAAKQVVVTPSSLVDNWRQEFCTWLGNHRCRPVTVNVTGKEAESRVRDFCVGSASVHPVLIISYEMFRKYAKTINSADIGLLVCDEGHRLKNSVGNKTIAALNAAPTKRRILLSGTPVQNELKEFFAMTSFVNPSLLGSLSTFKRVFQVPIEKGRDRSASPAQQDLGRQRSEELSKIVRRFVLRRTSDVLKSFLPPKTEYTVFCKLSPLQMKLYHCLLSQSHRLFGKSNTASALQLIGWLKQLSNDPDLLYPNLVQAAAKGRDGGDEECKEVVLTEEWRGSLCQALECFGASYQFPNDNMARSGKLQLVDNLLTAIRACGDKVVLVSNFTQTLTTLSRLCERRGFKYVRLDGSTDLSKRMQLVNSFNRDSSDTFVFLLSCKAGGCGLNLIGANRLVLFDPEWNPAIDRQAMARVWRDGQKKHVHIYRFIATGSIEERMYQRQILKEEVANAVVDNSLDGKRNFVRSDLRDVFKFDPKHQEDCGTYRLHLASLAKRTTQSTLTPSVKDASAPDDEWAYDGPSSVSDRELRAALTCADVPLVTYVRTQQFGAGASPPQEDDVGAGACSM